MSSLNLIKINLTPIKDLSHSLVVQAVDLYHSRPVLVGTITVGVGVVVLKWFFKKKPTVWEDQGIPVDHSSVVMNIIRFTWGRDKLLEFLVRSVKKNGKLFGAYQNGKPVLTCNKPDMIKYVLATDFQHFYSRVSLDEIFANPLIRKMLSVIEDFDDWKRVRSVVSPTFSTGKLRRMKPLIDECIETLIKNLDQLGKKGDVDVTKVFNGFATDVVVQVAFGTKIDSLYEPNHPLLSRTKKFTNNWVLFVVLFPKLAKMLRIDSTNKSTVNFYTKFVSQLIEERKNQKSSAKRCDFLQLMIDSVENQEEEEDAVYLTQDGDQYNKITTHNKKLTLEEIVSQCILFFFAATETTSATLSNVVYNLARNEDVQQKLYEEIANVIKSKVEIDYNVIASMKYLDGVVNETLRLDPPVLILQRTAMADYTFPEHDLKVPKGTVINITVPALHRDPEQFPDPEQFRPERFLPDNKTFNPYSYLPFGEGPRNCVGMRLALMEAKLALINVVWNYKFVVTKNTKIPPKVDFSSGLWAPTNMMLRVEKRNN